ncbi:MAG: glycosyltransferase family 2 protein [Phycisphaerales bacterium]
MLQATGGPRTLVAIPVYNEQKYVTRVLEKVRDYAHNILVIDDGSTDDTPMLLAKQPVDVIRHAENRGYGRSIRDAFRHSQCYKFDWLITMDCDEQHEPESLPDFYDAIAKDDSDIVSGSRYLGCDRCGDRRRPTDGRSTRGSRNDQPRPQGLSLTDAFCGYKAYRVSAASTCT